MDAAKLSLIENFPELIKTLPGNTIGKWGKMNAQQMTEHVSGFFKVSTRQLYFDLVTPEEYLPKAKAFLLSDKQFRENTKAVMLPEEPSALQYPSMKKAIEDLKKQVGLFVQQFTSGEIISSQHPVFGDLNFEEWVLLHYKHVTHHARQFGLM